MTPTPSSEAVLFDSVLVANRGEIARRIIRTLRILGIRSVAVYSDADAGALHVTEADLAVRIGPASPMASYLDIAAVIGAAVATGARAIHPGYGFLSENAEFARACDRAGIVFIGPGSEALDIMGDKIRSKKHVEQHGIGVIPGIAEPGLTDAELIDAAAAIGYPILVKPSAGGGGKGMEGVANASELPGALATARRVAASAFGDDTLFLERIVVAPRHIEVQILADAHGNVIHLGERECSLQRRHQKVIEEAPSSLLNAETRRRIGEAACEVARSVEYRGAGTIEFLVSADAPDEFYFMEMNARLQVEHPVTEQVTGIDLVEWQLAIAAGRELTIRQDDVVITGHAIEARLYAEAPALGFLPQTGTVLALCEASGPGIRVDSALDEGLVIGESYDPLLAKVIATADTRAAAIARLDRALADTVVLGVSTNIGFLRGLLADDRVRTGDIDTTLIDRIVDGIVDGPFDGMGEPAAPEYAVIAAAFAWHAARWSQRPGRMAGALWTAPTGWRLGTTRAVNLVLRHGDNEWTVSVIGRPDNATVAVSGGKNLAASWVPIDGVAHRLTIEGLTRVLHTVVTASAIWISEAGRAREFSIPTREARLVTELLSRDRVAGVVSPDVRAPMPGTVVSVSRDTGESVLAGETLLAIEAMKMEHKLAAGVAGVVTIHVQPGDLVKLNQLVATIEPDETHDVSRGEDPA